MVTLALSVLALSAPEPASAQANVLYARVTDGFEISLTHASGAPVTHLDAGTYTIHVDDSARGHNFHLVGPGGVDFDSGVAETRPGLTWTVTFVDGIYTFVCDLHPSSMAGSFTVGNVLRVRREGTGYGTVTSGPPGIYCGSLCTAGFPAGTAVTLTAAPGPGAAFAGWSGEGCTGTGSCTVTLAGAKTVTATFVSFIGTAPAPPPPATIAGVAVRKVGGVRVVAVRLRVARYAAASAQLVRRGRVVASARAHVVPGMRALRIRMPRSAPAGRYLLWLTTAENGRRTSASRWVRIGR